MPCEHYTIKRNKVKGYCARVLKKDPTLFEMNELVDDCLFIFERFQKQYIIIPSLRSIRYLLKRNRLSQFDHPLVSLTHKKKQDVI